MHFALPPRKTSQPPPYARVAQKSAATQRRRRIQLLGYIVLSALSIYLIVRYVLGTRSTHFQDGAIEEDPTITIVTVFDEAKMSQAYIDLIKANRDDYAARHGYTNFYTSVSNYTDMTSPSPTSWTLIPACRHALTTYSRTQYLWALSPYALITSPSISLSTHIFSNLSSLMQKDIPVVPPDSVIHTFSHLTPRSADLIISQDMDNLAHTSFLLRSTPTTSQSTDNWAHYFLDAWFDPLYRAYNFQKAENHALEHIVQWHPTVLAKLVLIPQRTMNSYNFATSPMVVDGRTGEKRTHDSMWQQGDLVVNLKGCDTMEGRNCEEEMQGYEQRWRAEVARLGD